MKNLKQLHKRGLSLFVALMMCLSLVQVTAMAEENMILDENNNMVSCDHIWNDGEITKEATCTAEGEKTFTCTVEDCGETRTETVPMAAHTPEIMEAIAPTETEPGLTEGSRCLICGTTLKAQESIPATGVEVPTEFLNAVDALRDLDDAALLAGVEAAEALYNGLTEAQKALESVSQRKTALDTFRQTMMLGDELPTTVSGTWFKMDWTLDTTTGTLTYSPNPGITHPAYNSAYAYTPGPVVQDLQSYKDQIQKVVIKEGITKLTQYAFKDLTNLESVEISNTVTEIGFRAFENCRSLKSIEIPQSVVTINNGFIGCTALEKVTLPNSMKTIPTFAGCTALKEINIPTSATAIPPYVFSGCTSLTAINIPNNVTSVGEGAFKGSGLASIEIPDSVTEIGKSVFADCKALTTIRLSGNMSEISSDIFKGCVALENVTLPNSIKTLPSFAGSSLTEIVIPEGVTSIPYYTFANCASLKKVTLPNSLVSIEKQAFAGSGLTSIEIPDSVTEIGDSAFNGCKALAEIKLPKNDKFTRIADSLFSYCSSLKSIEIPDSVTYLGKNAFWYTGLTSLFIPKSVTEMGALAFLGCYDLKSVVIEEGATTPLAGGGAFYACGNLTSVMLPSTLTTIGIDTFNNDEGRMDSNNNPVIMKLPILVIPNSVTTIGARAFAKNDELVIVGSQQVLSAIGTENEPQAKMIYVTGELAKLENPIKDCAVVYLGSNEIPEITTVTKLPVPTKDDAIFAGWYETADFSGNRVANDAAEAGKVYYARWCTAHQWDGGVTTTAPTYTSEGVMTYTCTVCGTTRTESIGRLIYTEPYFPDFTPTYPTTGGTGNGGTTGGTTITDPDTPLDDGTTITDDETPLVRNPLLFRDVPEDMWCRDAVAYVFDKGLMKGISDTVFAPAMSTERGMIVTILHRLEGEPTAAASSFTDVAAGKWYTDAIAWGAANGVVEGYSDTIFKPTQDITREQLAAILFRYAQLKGYDTSKRADLSAYTDAGEISAYALEAMRWAVAEELISGVTSYTLVPGGRADRAQVATILMRFCENIVPA